MLPCQCHSFILYTFLQTTVTKDNIGIVVDDFITRSVESCSHVFFSQSQTNGVRNTLTQRPSRYFDSINSMISFWMPRSSMVNKKLTCFPFDGMILDRQWRCCIQSNATLRIARHNHDHWIEQIYPC